MKGWHPPPVPPLAHGKYSQAARALPPQNSFFLWLSTLQLLPFGRTCGLELLAVVPLSLTAHLFAYFVEDHLLPSSRRQTAINTTKRSEVPITF